MSATVNYSKVQKQNAGDVQVKLYIQNGNTVYEPVVLNNISWTTEWKGSPGQLQFSMRADDKVKFAEGNAVRLTVDGVNLFYGFIFTQKRGKEGAYDITAYDQLRYLKNKDSYIYTNKTAGQLVRMIAADFRLNCGEIANTGEQLTADWEAAIQPGRTYKLNAAEQTIMGYCDGREAVEQAIYLILNTERFAWVIYSWAYGSELQSLFGKPAPFVTAELPRRIQEALLQDDRIESVSNFNITQGKGILTVTFDAETLHGVISVSKEVAF